MDPEFSQSGIKRVTKLANSTLQHFPGPPDSSSANEERAVENSVAKTPKSSGQPDTKLPVARQKRPLAASRGRKLPWLQGHHKASITRAVARNTPGGYDAESEHESLSEDPKEPETETSSQRSSWQPANPSWGSREPAPAQGPPSQPSTRLSNASNRGPSLQAPATVPGKKHPLALFSPDSRPPDGVSLLDDDSLSLSQSEDRKRPALLRGNANDNSPSTPRASLEDPKTRKSPDASTQPSSTSETFGQQNSSPKAIPGIQVDKAVATPNKIRPASAPSATSSSLGDAVAGLEGPIRHIILAADKKTAPEKSSKAAEISRDSAEGLRRASTADGRTHCPGFVSKSESCDSDAYPPDSTGTSSSSSSSLLGQDKYFGDSFIHTTSFPTVRADKKIARGRSEDIELENLNKRNPQRSLEETPPHPRHLNHDSVESIAVDWSYVPKNRRTASTSSSEFTSSEGSHLAKQSQEQLIPCQPSLARCAPAERKEHLVRNVHFDDSRSAPRVDKVIKEGVSPLSKPKSEGDSSQSSDTEQIYGLEPWEMENSPRHRHHRRRRRQSRPENLMDEERGGYFSTRSRRSTDISKLSSRSRTHRLSWREYSNYWHHQHQPIARDWGRTKKRVAATISCMNTALVGLLIGIYAGEVPRIQYQLGDDEHHVILGNTIFCVGMAITTFCAWPLPLLHGRKPYTVAALTLALPLQLPQGVITGTQRSPENPIFQVGLLVPRAISGLVVGLANGNFIATLLDVFGASLMSASPHQEIVYYNDERRHGGGMGVWLGVWAWCYIGSIPLGFFIGAAIIDNSNPAWGFHLAVILVAVVTVINVIGPETRRAPWRRAYASAQDFYQRNRRVIARGEIKLHISADPPTWWVDEVWSGIKLQLRMLAQPGFLVLSLYLAWIYAQMTLVVVLLGALLSRQYRWHATEVGLGVFSVAVGALLAIPLTKAGVLSRARKQRARTDSMTVTARVTWSSHLVRRIVFTTALPFLGLAYTLSSAGELVHWIVPIIFAGAIGFLSNLAIAECYGLIMETYDTCDLQPGVNTRHRRQSMPSEVLRRRSNYSSFPRVAAGIFATQTIGFLLAAAATAIGGVLTRGIGPQASTGVTAGILLFLTILLTLVLLRWKEVQVVPDSAFRAWRRSLAMLDSGKAVEEWKDWKPVVIGNPSGKTRRMSLLELGALSRWSEIRRLNKLTTKMPGRGE